MLPRACFRYCRSYAWEGGTVRRVPEVRVPFDHVASRVANTGASFALGVALYLLFVLMFLTMIAEILLVHW